MSLRICVAYDGITRRLVVWDPSAVIIMLMIGWNVQNF
jgi:hypothetical protein